MIRENFTYKTIQKMIEQIENGRQFASPLKGRCFKEAFFDDLENLIDFNNSGQRKSKVIHLPFTRRYPLAIAASISLLVVALYFSVRLILPNEIQTAYGEFKIIDLPDHSTITLNAKSEVVYNPISWYWDRKVLLAGEAFFEVEKGSDFIVETNVGAVRVLGTSFNVRQRENDFEVKCKTGLVEVNVNDHQVLLQANERVALNGLNGQLEKDLAKVEYISTWKEGYFNFDAEPLDRVIEELEIQYGVSINFAANNEDLLFTGYFPVKDLDNSLKTICTSFGLSYKIMPGEDNSTEIIIE